jgi:hypothetical protein
MERRYDGSVGRGKTFRDRKGKGRMGPLCETERKKRLFGKEAIADALATRKKVEEGESARGENPF